VLLPVDLAIGPKSIMNEPIPIFLLFCRMSGLSGGERSPFEGSCCGSSYNNVSTSTADEEEVTKYRVVLLGDSGVGKSALVNQFMTSEYMNTYDASLGKSVFFLVSSY